jgi:hypothetical protein
MTAEDCEDARSQPVVPSVKFAAALLLVHSVRVSSESWQPSEEREGRHVYVCCFSVWSGHRTARKLHGHSIASQSVEWMDKK